MDSASAGSGHRCCALSWRRRRWSSAVMPRHVMSWWTMTALFHVSMRRCCKSACDTQSTAAGDGASYIPLELIDLGFGLCSFDKSGAIYLADLNSANGTRCNNEPLATGELRRLLINDSFRLGDSRQLFILKVSCSMDSKIERPPIVRRQARPPRRTEVNAPNAKSFLAVWWLDCNPVTLVTTDSQSHHIDTAAIASRRCT
jgi:hypothetical protein